MAKKTSKKKTTRSTRSKAGSGNGAASAAGKHLVIVESPAKAKTINKYLGSGYVVKASVGHVRDLPKRNPKGVKNPVPGVDLEGNFTPDYEVISGKGKTVTDLKRTAKAADDIWFATDLDREGEAIAWHLAEALKVPTDKAKRVVFNAITKAEIQRAFDHPRPLDMDKVNAQQARRILDRIVGYQVSPLLWKKVAGGLSAGRVQSVAVRLVVEREQEIDAFMPEEYWRITGYFTAETLIADKLRAAWLDWLAEGVKEKAADPKSRSEGRTIRERNGWLNEHGSLSAELVEFDGKRFEPKNVDDALAAAQAAGFSVEDRQLTDDPKGKGPAAKRITLTGPVDPAAADWRVRSIQTKRRSSRPYPPYITSTLQQGAASALSFAAATTMRVAQQLYEGVEMGGMGSVGLITYMRTDSTHLSNEAIDSARGFIHKQFGDDYLPDKPNLYKSSNKSAQEAHEAIRPTDVSITPEDARRYLDDRQYKLYRLIWQRFVACQMAPAQWDGTTIKLGADTGRGDVVFKCTGRTLVFDGFYKVVGVPKLSDELTLPELKEGQSLAPLQVDPVQHFTNPPARYTEASLVKKLEAEGIGRPSTYASIIKVIQDRNYVEKIGSSFHATDLGEVVTAKLIEGFPRIMDIGYTREMEAELDAIEEQHHDWVEFLRKFYGPFSENLERAAEQMSHAKAETVQAPYDCPECGRSTCYRFGKNGRFLSCTGFDIPPVEVHPEGHDGLHLLHKPSGKKNPKVENAETNKSLAWSKLTDADKDKFKQLAAEMPERCTWAAPVDREGRPQTPEATEVACPECGKALLLRKGRFGPFLSCSGYPDCKGIVNLDKKGHVTPPKVPPLETDLPCPKCESPLNLRNGKRGPWLSCSKFPKCRGRGAWGKLDEKTQKKWEVALANHEKENPQPIIKLLDGKPVPEDYEPKAAIAEASSTSDADLDGE